MTTIEDKIRLFSKIIYDRIKEEKMAELDAFDVERVSKISELNKFLEEKRQAELKETRKNAKLKYVEIISKEKTRLQKEELKLIEGLMDDVMKELIEQVEVYTNSDKYKSMLITSIQKYLGNVSSDSYIIYLSEKDYDSVKDTLIANLQGVSAKIEVKAANWKLLGGFLIEEKVKKVRIDNSFSSKLIDLKGYIGLRISESIE